MTDVRWSDTELKTPHTPRPSRQALSCLLRVPHKQMIMSECIWIMKSPIESGIILCISLQNKCRTADPDWQNLGLSGKLSFLIIYKFWQNCASIQQVSDLILKTGVCTQPMRDGTVTPSLTDWVHTQNDPCRCAPHPCPQSHLDNSLEHVLNVRAHSAYGSQLLLDAEPFLDNDLVLAGLADVDSQVMEAATQRTSGALHYHLTVFDAHLHWKT